MHNIGRIANEGTRFTECYAKQSCANGRAALITGQFTARKGLKAGIPGFDRELRAEDRVDDRQDRQD